MTEVRQYTIKHTIYTGKIIITTTLKKLQKNLIIHRLRNPETNKIQKVVKLATLRSKQEKRKTSKYQENCREGQKLEEKSQLRFCLVQITNSKFE